MPIRKRLADMHADITAWRRDFHMYPELLYDTHRTSGIVADKLRGFGCDAVETGIGRTGVVGVIHGKTNTSGRTIGLRADMDALPIIEATGPPTPQPSPAKCTPADTTAIPQCCSAPRDIWQKPAILTAPSP